MLRRWHETDSGPDRGKGQAVSETGENLIVLMSTNDAIEANLIQGLLESNGIEAVIDSKGVSGLVTGEVDSLTSSYDILVGEKDLADAKRVLEDQKRHYEEDVEWRKQLAAVKQRNWFLRRIVGFFIGATFGVLSYLNASDKTLAYILAGCSFLFCLLIIFSFISDRRKERR